MICDLQIKESFNIYHSDYLPGNMFAVIFSYLQRSSANTDCADQLSALVKQGKAKAPDTELAQVRKRKAILLDLRDLTQKTPVLVHGQHPRLKRGHQLHPRLVWLIIDIPDLLHVHRVLKLVAMNANQYILYALGEHSSDPENVGYFSHYGHIMRAQVFGSSLGLYM